MKRKVLSILLIFASCILMTLKAQTIIAGFEDGTATVTSGDGGIDFEVPAAIVVNPYISGINKSDSVVIVQRANGSTLWDDSVKIDFGSDQVYDWSNKLLMDVWIDHPCYIMVTLQNNTSGVIEKWGPFKQWINDTLKWVQLSLLPTSYGAAINYDPISGSGICNFDAITLRFGNTDSSDSPILAYIDKISYYPSYSSPQDTIEDFEESAVIGLFQSAEFDTIYVTANPSVDADNGSDSVLFVSGANANDCWIGDIGFILDTAVNTADFNKFECDVYNAAAGNLLVTLYNDDVVFDSWVGPRIETTNTWTHISTMAVMPNWENIDSIGIVFGDWNNDNAAVDCYFDNIIIGYSLPPGCCGDDINNEYIVIKRTSAPVVIDGQADQVFDSVEPEAIGAAMEDFTATYKALYDNDFLYLLVDVSDDSLFYPPNSGSTLISEINGIQIYTDGNLMYYNDYRVKEQQLQTIFTVDSSSAICDVNLRDSIDWANSIEDGSYAYEFAIPWSRFYRPYYYNNANADARVASSVIAGAYFGFEISIINYVRTHRFNWASNSYVESSSQYYGVIQLSSEIVTGISDTKGSLSDIKTYPNPCIDILNIESTNGRKLEVYNLLGAKISEQTINNGAVLINTSVLPKGLYIIKVYDANNLFRTTKFQKQ